MSVITRISDVTAITRPSKVSAVRSLCADSAPRASRSVSEVRICDWIVQGRPHAAPIFSESPLHLFTLANDAGIQILGEGDLRNRQDEALRFALSLDLLDAFGTPLLGSWAFPRKAKGHLRPLADGPKMPLLFNSFCWL